VCRYSGCGSLTPSTTPSCCSGCPSSPSHTVRPQLAAAPLRLNILFFTQALHFIFHSGFPFYFSLRHYILFFTQALHFIFHSGITFYFLLRHYILFFTQELHFIFHSGITFYFSLRLFILFSPKTKVERMFIGVTLSVSRALVSPRTTLQSCGANLMIFYLCHLHGTRQFSFPVI